MSRISLFLALPIMALLAAQSSDSYRITHRYLLGGEGRWDYVVPDPPNHRVFIARQDHLMVVDENTGQLLGEVTGIAVPWAPVMAATPPTSCTPLSCTTS